MRKYSSTLSFIDLLFNLLLAFVCLFILSFILINPQKNEGIIDPNAEFIVTLTWDNQVNDDVDLWVEDPDGNIVSFAKREAGLMHLDRDDQGTDHDTIETNQGGQITYQHNQEMVTIRGIIPGEYVVNTHMYSMSSEPPTDVSVQVLKLNPYKNICEKRIQMTRGGEEVTICRFELDSRGNVTGTSDLPKRLFGAY